MALRRRQRGLSQQKLADLAGLRREKVNRVESRGEDIGLHDLCRLLDALGLELSAVPKGRPKAAAGQPSAAGIAEALAPEDFRKAAFLDGSKIKVLHWGKIPR
jgi:transcriptional regulator with XRE-family HTH domain